MPDESELEPEETSILDRKPTEVQFRPFPLDKLYKPEEGAIFCPGGVANEEDAIDSCGFRNYSEGQFMTECCDCGAQYPDGEVPEACKCGSRDFAAM